MIKIPKQLQKTDFRFIKLKAKDKIPIEKRWQNKANYKYDDEQIIKLHRGNIGVIGGKGRLRIIDADDKEFAEEIKQKLPETFTVKTGSGGLHFYVLSDYDTNHVFVDGKGEFRAKNYQVVIAGSTHPNGKKYVVMVDKPIAELSKEQVATIIKPYLRPELAKTKEEKGNAKDKTRSGEEYRQIIKLISKGLSKREVFKEMQVYAKWSNAHPTYRSMTYDKAKKYIEQQKEVKCKNTVTPVTTVTTVTEIRSWGYININKRIMIEQVGNKDYLYNYQGKKDICNINYGNPEGEKQLKRFIQATDLRTDISEIQKKTEIKNHKKYIDTKYKPYYHLFIENQIFRFKSKPEEAMYFKPSKSKCEDYIKGNVKIRPFNELFQDIKKALKILYDFKFDYDNTLSAFAIASTWVIPHLKAVFYLGVDATKGGGKTTLLEILRCLCRHGFLAGDISYSAIPRMKDEYDLNITVDEIDQLNPNQKADIEGLMRKGQRRGNPYTRLNKNTLKAEVFQSFGFYAYTFRSEVEDAFMSRSILVHSVVSSDERLPIIDYYKEELLKPLFDDVFFWYFDNILSLQGLVTVVTELQQLRTFDTLNNQIDDIRKELYDHILKDFSEEELSVFKDLTGRNIEIGYILTTICKLLRLDIHSEIKSVLKLKQENEDIPEQFYIEKLKDFIISKISDLDKNGFWFLKSGKFEGCYYYPKSELYGDYITMLKSKDVMTIGSTKFNGFLRDIGFVWDYNIVNQKHFERKSQLRCCVFDKSIFEKLGEACAFHTIPAPEEKIDDLYDIIKTNDNGSGVSFEILMDKSKWQEGDLSKELLSLSKRGDVFECKKGFWKVL